MSGLMMQIQYQFHPGKTIQVVAYFLDKLGNETDKVKLMKLIYLADRASFLQNGSPLTGDRQVAMKFGPVPSATLNLVNGDDWEEDTFFTVVNHRVKLIADPGVALLGEQEIAILDGVLGEHGSKHTWALRDETHAYPEYKEAYVEGTSTEIPYELMLKHYAGEAGFRKGRAVVNQEMIKSISCPFPSSETDL